MNDSYGFVPQGVDAPGGVLGQFAAVASVLDAAEIVLYVADLETHEMLYMNAHAKRLWDADGVGKPCYEVLQTGQSGPCAFCTNARLTENGRAAVHPVVWDFQNTANRHWYLCIDKAIPWSDGRLVRMEMAIDITERHALEQFREQYVGLISHDLRTPLSTIALSACSLKPLLEGAGLAAGTPAVETILRSTRRMAEMIEDLLETTRLESGQLQLHLSSFDLAQLARASAEQLGAAASRAIVFESGGAVAVRADAGRLERVLENLISNALHYSRSDSPVTVRIESNALEARVTVIDRGIGIAAHELPKLFQRFGRASGKRRSANSVGLGLYNSRLILEHHGGRIWAESEPGEGSTFRFVLPMAPLPQ